MNRKKDDKKEENNKCKSIVLAKVETDHDEDLFPPFGLMYLADALEKAGFEMEIWHGRNKELKELYNQVNELRPLFVGFSTYTMPNLKPTIKASKEIHKYGYKIIWGGVHATILPSLCMNEDFIDFVCLREGEDSIVRLAQTLSEGKNPTGIVGIANGENYTFSPFVDLDKYEPRWDKINIESYLLKNQWGKRVLPFVTSRGCPYRCGFCYSQAVNKRRWRMHSVEFITEQIKKLKTLYQIDGISFRDENLFVNKKRAMEIIENLNMPFYAPIRADSINDDFAYWLAEHNCKELFIGAESGVQKLLDLMTKDITLNDIRRAVKALSHTNIKIILGFILGLPTETKKEQIRTLEFIAELHRLHSNIHVSLSCYTPYPSTSLWEHTVKAGFIPPNTNEGWAVDRIDVAEYLPWMDFNEFALMKLFCMSLENQKTSSNIFRRVLITMMKPSLSLRWKLRYFSYPFEVIVPLKIRKLLIRLGVI